VIKMPNKDGRGRLGRGKNCDSVAVSDRIRGRRNGGNGRLNPRGELRPRYRK